MKEPSASSRSIWFLEELEFPLISRVFDVNFCFEQESPILERFQNRKVNNSHLRKDKQETPLLKYKQQHCLIYDTFVEDNLDLNAQFNFSSKYPPNESPFNT